MREDGNENENYIVLRLLPAAGLPSEPVGGSLRAG